MCFKKGNREPKTTIKSPTCCYWQLSCYECFMSYITQPTERNRLLWRSMTVHWKVNVHQFQVDNMCKASRNPYSQNSNCTKCY